MAERDAQLKEQAASHAAAQDALQTRILEPHRAAETRARRDDRHAPLAVRALAGQHASMLPRRGIEQVSELMAADAGLSHAAGSGVGGIWDGCFRIVRRLARR